MPTKAMLVVPVIVSLMGGDRAAPATVAHTAGSDTERRVCAQPFPETEEQRIQRHFREAVAVFSGFVRAMTLERANVLVLRTWKGQLGAEVVLPTGLRDNGNGTHTILGEPFPLRRGETYLLFGYGKSTDSMTVSVCEPNGLLKRSTATVALLDKLVKTTK
jgi:hypothetical protein